jgi:predicted  nucleic acid-binding Zn-ribbon protein
MTKAASLKKKMKDLEKDKKQMFDAQFQRLQWEYKEYQNKFTSWKDFSVNPPYTLQSIEASLDGVKKDITDLQKAITSAEENKKSRCVVF